MKSPTLADTTVPQYDPNGNLKSRTTSRGTASYTYDASDRLKTEFGPGVNQAFGYDPNGNRQNDGSNTYAIAPHGNRIQAVNGITQVYDPAGNLLDDGQGKTYTYNAAGRLKEVKLNNVLVATYQYNYRGLRVRKTTPQGVTRYHYDREGHLIETSDNTGVPQHTYVWAEDRPIAQIDHTGPADQIAYLHTDPLNTPRSATDENQRIVWRWEGGAFGDTAPEENPDGDGKLTKIDLRFPGMVADQETGLYYNWNRYYDPKTGGYITVEPLGVVPGVGNSPTVPREITEYFRSIPLNDRLVRGLNHLYRYAYNNPLTYIDPDGLMGRGAGGGKSMPGPLRFGGGGAAPIEGPFGPVCGSGRSATWIPDGPWKDACQKHDDCYSRCGASRLQCDIHFLFDSYGNVTYFIAVRVRGRPPFQDAQNESCCSQSK